MSNFKAGGPSVFSLLADFLRLLWVYKENDCFDKAAFQKKKVALEFLFTLYSKCFVTHINSS